MADKEEKGIDGRAPDPFVAARINDPAAPPPASFQLAGLLGDSDRDGIRRLYLNTTLDYYVEFKTDDVLAVESVTPDQPPFVGLDATRVTLNRDAQVEYVHSRPAAADAFNVDAQSGPPGGFGVDTIETGTQPTAPTWTLPTDLTDTLPQTPGCVPDTILRGCFPTRQTMCVSCGIACITRNITCQVTACNTCRTCRGATCATCDDATCVTCGQATCATCDQATCQTCQQATCATCNNCFTIPGGVTCQTCIAARCWQTIGQATCATCRLTNCNNNCVSQLVPCVTQNRCPTLVCP